MKHVLGLIMTVLALGTLAGGVAGCGGVSGPLRAEPTKDASSYLRPRFQARYFRIDRDGNYHFLLEAKDKDAKTGQEIEEAAVITVFWRPRPGRTPILESALNATYRLVVLTPTGAGMYEGAGFVRLHNGAGARTMHASLEDGDLKLTQATANFNDVLGRSRFRGNFKGTRSDWETMDRTLALQRAFFARSLAAGGGPAAATQPRPE